MQRLDRRVEIAMFLLQPCEFCAEVTFVVIIHEGAAWPWSRTDGACSLQRCSNIACAAQGCKMPRDAYDSFPVFAFVKQL